MSIMDTGMQKFKASWLDSLVVVGQVCLVCVFVFVCECAHAHSVFPLGHTFGDL